MTRQRGSAPRIERKCKVLIAITGLPGSGKSTFARQISSDGARMLVMGDVVRDEALRSGIGNDIDAMRTLMIDLRKRYGEDYVAEVICRRIELMEDELIVIDGIRSLVEVHYFKSRFKNVFLIAVISSLEKRFQRLRERGRDDDPRTMDELSRRDESELSVGIGQAISEADVIIENQGSLDELNKRARAILKWVAGN